MAKKCKKVKNFLLLPELTNRLIIGNFWMLFKNEKLFHGKTIFLLYET
jgi:hypothetical protein